MRVIASRKGMQVERKFLKCAQAGAEWLFSSQKPAAQVANELKQLSEADKKRPIKLKVVGEHGKDERTFPSTTWALVWLEEDERDHSWEYVCKPCAEGIRGLELTHS